MFAILSKLIPFRDYVYAAAAIALITWYNIHVHNLEVAYGAKERAAVMSAVDAATAQALSAAKKIADAKDKQYQIQLAQVKDTYENHIKADDAAHAADIARLRQLSAQGNSNANPVLPSASGTSAAGGQSGSSTESLGFVPAELGAELADALRATRDQRDLCYAERDSLTGK